MVTAYQRFRAAGYSPADSLRSAQICARFNAAESAGLVELIAKPDDSPDLSYLDQDCFNDTPAARRATARERETIARDGVWGVVGRYRVSPTAPWVSADSIWGCAGYRDALSPLENIYVPDIMDQTLDALKRTLAARFCRHCGGKQ